MDGKATVVGKKKAKKVVWTMKKMLEFSRKQGRGWSDKSIHPDRKYQSKVFPTKGGLVAFTLSSKGGDGVTYYQARLFHPLYGGSTRRDVEFFKTLAQAQKSARELAKKY